MYAPDSRGTQDYMDLAREVIGSSGEIHLSGYTTEGAIETAQHYNDGKEDVNG